MTTPDLIITRGLPASGKTTWARDQIDNAPPGTLTRVNRDDLRQSMLHRVYGVPQMTSERMLTIATHAMIGSLLERKVSVIVDDTNLRRRWVIDLMEIAARRGAIVQFADQFLDVPPDECIARDDARRASRQRYVGAEVIRKMHAQFFQPGPPPQPTLDPLVSGRPYVPVPGTPRAIIVDIDGTLALHEGVRGPYDTSRYHLDRPNAAVITQVRMAWRDGYTILFTSGRDEEFRDVTADWLDRNCLHPDLVGELLMRPAGDTRNDAVVKLELFDNHIRDRYDVRFVFDDRNRVVDMWRSLGLQVNQVAPGAF